MNEIEKVEKKLVQIVKLIAQIEKLVARANKELNALKKQSNKASQTSENTYSEEQLKKEYEELYNSFINGGIENITEFVKAKKKEYLKAFCKANDLPLNVKKASKEMVKKEIINWFMQRRAIRKKVI
jgi:DNA mismatch repair protein MutH